MRTKKNKKKVNVNEVMTFCTISKVDGREQIKRYTVLLSIIYTVVKKNELLFLHTSHSIYSCGAGEHMTTHHV